MNTSSRSRVLALIFLAPFFLPACSDEGVPTTAAPDSPSLSAGPAERQVSNVYWFPEGDPLLEDDPVLVEGATARLVRTDRGVSYNLRTSGLMKGHAVTIWWVIFNNPEECDGDCGLEDLFVDFPNDLTPNPDVNPAVMSGGGNVVGRSGRAGFAGHLNEGQITTEHPAFLDGPGLTDAHGAEIHLVVRSHGPLIPEMMPEMIRTFEGGCSVFLPAGVVPEEEGECSDLQFAVFK